MKFADLHMHTIFSDGTLSPKEMVRLSREAELSAISITDHDTVDGIEEAIIEGEKIGITVIPGIEISSRKFGKSVHILGYLIDYHNMKLLQFVRNMREAREERGKKMVNKLNEIGINITMDEVKRIAGRGVVGRPHIARVLVKNKQVEDEREAFLKYIGDTCPCYVSKPNIPPVSVINLIKEVDGIPVLAHPGLLAPELEILDFIKDGIQGIEVWHPSHSKKNTEKYLEITKKFNLIATGGSDSHGELEGHPRIGDFKVPYTILENLVNYKAIH
jgi:hypothetical protein